MPVLNKMNVKLVAKLKTPGVYSDGGGLYLRIRPSLAKRGDMPDPDGKEIVAKSWIFVHGGSKKTKRIELGLGSFNDIPLAKAREKAEVVPDFWTGC